jgi:hypothetical protein
LRVSPQWAATNEELLRAYGYTLPDVTNALAIINIDLDPKDKLLESKQKLFSIGYLKNTSSETNFGIMIGTPWDEMSLQRIITPFRIKAYEGGPKYIETLINEFQEGKMTLLPFDRANEFSALQDLKESAENKLKEYVSTIEEDSNILNIPTIPDNERNIRTVLRAEKIFLKNLFDFANKSIEVFNLKYQDAINEASKMEATNVYTETLKSTIESLAKDK